MSPPRRDFAGVQAEGIDWTSRRRRWVCEACGALRALPVGRFHCLCRVPPVKLRQGVLTRAAAAGVARLAAKLSDR